MHRITMFQNYKYVKMTIVINVLVTLLTMLDHHRHYHYQHNAEIWNRHVLIYDTLLK